MPGKLFISHSTQDDDLVRRLRQALADLGQDGWIDSRELRGGDPLWPEIEAAIGTAAGLAVIVSTHGLQSKWLGKELTHALKLRAERGADRFPVIPLVVDGCELGVLEAFFGAEPLYIPISSAVGGIDAALHAILVALRLRDPSDQAPTIQPPAAPMEELVLELSRLSIHLADGKRRARGSARLVYEPADRDKREVRSPKRWMFEASLGPIEVEELRWYLETYAVWPSRFDEARVKGIEANLVTWGRLLHDAAMPADKAASVLQAWAQVGDGAARRFSVHVEPELDDGAPDADVQAAREAATLLLGLPWELLHDGRGFLFQGGRPVRVRRRLPNTHAVEPPVLASPLLAPFGSASASSALALHCVSSCGYTSCSRHHADFAVSSSDAVAITACSRAAAVHTRRAGSPPPLADSSAWASHRSSVEALTPTSADTLSTGALSGGSSLATTRSLYSLPYRATSSPRLRPLFGFYRRGNYSDVGGGWSSACCARTACCW